MLKLIRRCLMPEQVASARMMIGFVAMRRVAR